MAVTGIVTTIVLIAAVIAWMRSRRVVRHIVPPAEAGSPAEAVVAIRREPVEIWISLPAAAAAHRRRIVNEIESANLGDVVESATDILLETADLERAQREVRTILARAGIVATISITRAADGDVN